MCWHWSTVGTFNATQPQYVAIGLPLTSPPSPSPWSHRVSATCSEIKNEKLHWIELNEWRRPRDQEQDQFFASRDKDEDKVCTNAMQCIQMLTMTTTRQIIITNFNRRAAAAREFVTVLYTNDRDTLRDGLLSLSFSCSSCCCCAAAILTFDSFISSSL